MLSGMQAKTALLYPSIVMALLSLSVLLTLGARRYVAVRRRAMNLKYYRTYDEGAEPPGLRQHSRHAQNHFEVPPLFHMAVLLTYLVGEVSASTLGVAWFFVASRALHSVIHLTYNNVSHRFAVFATGVVAVFVLWGRLLATLLGV
jgi:hypothetical protein